MRKYESPLHIASAFVVENGITIGQLASEGKGKEIPCVRVDSIVGYRRSNDSNRCVALPEKDSQRDIGGRSRLCIFGEEKSERVIC